MKIWAISDTHNKHGWLNIPDGIDMVIHAGDLGTVREPFLNEAPVLNALEWINSLPMKYKVVIAGNHDTSIENHLVYPKKEYPNITYLQHESVEIEGIKIFGSPYTPSFGEGWSFNKGRHKLEPLWAEIPDDTDILITHGPPKGILDLTAEGNGFFQCGCKSLLNKVKVVQPKFHIFGHIHTESDCPNAGILEIQNCKTKFVNASVLNLNYDICNNGYIIEIL